MNSLLEQVKKRRLSLALKQHDLMLRVGMSLQQYQRLESKGNPRLDTLELIAKGLKSELLLIPQERINAVLVDDTETISGLRYRDNQSLCMCRMKLSQCAITGDGLRQSLY